METVPEKVQTLFEAARGAMAYGYFFYPLYTLSTEQLFRVAEAAIKFKCIELSAPKNKITFFHQINWLVEKKTIEEKDIVSWEFLRKYRNDFSHPKDQNIIPPGIAFDLLEMLAEKINGLFKA